MHSLNQQYKLYRPEAMHWQHRSQLVIALQQSINVQPLDID